MADPLESLRQAIARNSGAVLSLPSAGMLRHCKSRFLAEDGEGFWMESAAGEGALIDKLAAAGTPVGVAFKAGTCKVVFASPICRREAEFRVNAQLALEALLLRFPEQVKEVQRRANYRVQIPAQCEISLRIWRIPEHWILRDRPSATLELPARMRDLSTGGVGVIIPAAEGEPARLAGDQRLRIVVKYEQMEVLLEGRARHVKAMPDKSLRVGVQFKKLEDDLEGRQTLAKLTSIVGQLHRAEVRRTRLGLVG